MVVPDQRIHIKIDELFMHHGKDYRIELCGRGFIGHRHTILLGYMLCIDIRVIGRWDWSVLSKYDRH